MNYYEKYMDGLFDKNILIEHLKSIMEISEIQEILKKTPTYNNSGEKMFQNYYELLEFVISRG